MSQANLPKLPSHLIKAVNNKTLLPVVGAGVSMSIEDDDGNRVFPSWAELLKNAAKEAQSDVIKGLVDEKEYQMAADLARKKLKGATWGDFLVSQFDKKLENIDRKTLALPQAIWQLSNQIITLNYDEVLKWALQDTQSIAEIDNHNEAELIRFSRNQTNKPTVWHLHGRIGNSGSILLTSPGYENLYGDNQHYQAGLTTLKTMSSQQTLLFIGCSMDDTELLAEIDYQYALFGKGTGPHYVLVRESQEDLVKSKINDELLEVITFEDFGPPLIELVESIAAAKTPEQLGDQSGDEPNNEQPQPDETPAKTKIAVLTASPITDEQDYHHWLENFDKLDAQINHYNLTVENLNDLDDEYQYVFVLSKLYHDQLLLEDEYIAKETMTFAEVESNIGISSPKGVFYLLDKLPENDVTQKLELDHPSLVIALNDSKKCKKAIFDLFRKNNFSKIENCIAINKSQLDLTACSHNNNGRGITNNTSSLPLAVDPSNLNNLVGRIGDFENLSRKLIKLIGGVGVLTLKGAGGIGKTTSVKKVAFELAKRRYFKSGVYFIDCEAIGDKTDVYDEFAEQIAKIFNLAYNTHLNTAQNSTLDISAIRAQHHKKDRLIIVDNLETLLYTSDKQQCLELLQQISHSATVAITSRELSKIEGEELYELRPFTVDEAFEYFIQQAKLTELTDAEVRLIREDIVQTLLNNNPLAIKLVTANMPAGKQLSALRDDLQDNIFAKTTDDDLITFDAKTDTNIDRKRSMYGSIAYSYQNLTTDEQTALLLLSTFPDGLPIEGLTRIQNWAEKEKQELETQITDRTIKALQDKSLVETHGGEVFLQSLVAKFAENKLVNHDDKGRILADAFAFQQKLVIAIDALAQVSRTLALSIAGSMLGTLANSIELSVKLKSDSVQVLKYIQRVCSVLMKMGELSLLQKHLNKVIEYFDSEQKELVQLWRESCAISFNSLVDFDALKQDILKPQFSFLNKFNLDVFLDVNFTSDIALYIELIETLKEYDVKSSRNFFPTLFFSHGAIDANIAKQLEDSTTNEIEIKSQFNVITTNDLDKEINSYHPNDVQKLEQSYMRAKLKPLNQKQLTDLPDFIYCRAIGLKALIYAFSETDLIQKEALFKRAIRNLKASPYRYVEAHLYYTEFLKAHNRDEYKQIAKDGMAVVKKHFLNYLHYQFDKLLGKTDKSEYSPADYPLPFGIDLQPYVQEYIKEHGVKSNKGTKKIGNNKKKTKNRKARK